MDSKKLIRRWDSERKLFTTTYIIHALAYIEFTSLIESTHVVCETVQRIVGCSACTMSS